MNSYQQGTLLAGNKDTIKGIRKKSKDPGALGNRKAKN